MNKVAKKISEDAVERASHIRGESIKEAEKLRELYNERLDKAKQEQDIVLAAVYQDNLDKICSLVNLESRKRLLSRKQVLLNLVKDEMLNDLKSDRKLYLDLLQQLILTGASTGEEEVHVSEKDKSLIDSNIMSDLNRRIEKRLNKRANLTLAKDPRKISSGVILSGKLFEYNSSLEVVLETVFDEEKIEIASKLFSE